MARVTSKGQVTIPKEVRDKLGIGPGSNIGFEEQGGHVVLVRAEEVEGENKGARLVRKLAEFGERARRNGWLNDLSTDEVLDMTRGSLDDIKPR
ncbi:MAG: AbrB/MazE/SpoVT family DNA-binding domain-containing protein [Aestuariivirga sp.]